MFGVRRRHSEKTIRTLRPFSFVRLITRKLLGNLYALFSFQENATQSKVSIHDPFSILHFWVQYVLHIKHHNTLNILCTLYPYSM
ncbi:hypothetical protein Hdeb2414_s0002g00062441 [Helianthus debilis subsp. tardiflorus]